MNKPFGPLFVQELERAGLAALPISWSDEGDVYGLDNLTAEQISALDALIAAHDPEAAPPVVTVVYPVDLWSRMSDEEAEQVETAMATQPIRLQNIFRYASSHRSDHEMWVLLQDMATQLFGAARAAEILAASS